MSRRRTTMLAAVLLPLGMALAALFAAAPAASAHSVVPAGSTVQGDHWGVGNG